MSNEVEAQEQPLAGFDSKAKDCANCIFRFYLTSEGGEGYKQSYLRFYRIMYVTSTGLSFYENLLKENTLDEVHLFLKEVSHRYSEATNESLNKRSDESKALKVFTSNLKKCRASIENKRFAKQFVDGFIKAQLKIKLGEAPKEFDSVEFFNDIIILAEHFTSMEIKNGELFEFFIPHQVKFDSKALFSIHYFIWLVLRDNFCLSKPIRIPKNAFYELCSSLLLDDNEEDELTYDNFNYLWKEYSNKLAPKD